MRLSLFPCLLPFYLAQFPIVGSPADLETNAGRQHIAFPDLRLVVYGLPGFNEDKPVLRRLPLRLKDTLRSPVWDLAQDPTGAGFVFAQIPQG